MTRPADISRAVDSALRSLAQERVMLMRGRVAEAAAAAEAREKALAPLRNLDEATAASLSGKLAALRAQTLRHASLLEAAIRGAGAARARLREMIAARRRLPGYDASGAPRETVSPTGGGRRV